MTSRSKTQTQLPQYKERFIDSLVKSGALKLDNDYKLKSGRESPYFFNVGGLNSGTSTSDLANAYASAISKELRGEFDYVYGIPEKGVALAPTITMALAKQNRIDAKWFFDRKGGEKQYGEATGKEDLSKIFLGAVPEERSRVLVIDDVLTTGGTKEDALKNLAKLLPNRKIVGVMIALDRQEVGINGRSAVDEFTEKTGVAVHSIIKATDILQYMQDKAEMEKPFARVSNYIRVYGTFDAHDQVMKGVQNKPIIESRNSLIPACDTADINTFERLVVQTHDLEGVGGYKVGFMLALTHGLPKVVETARKHTDKPLIYDHQKAATDIPDTAKEFMAANKNAGINSVILFPHTGPETERAWIYRGIENGLGIIVGGIMTHPAYLASEGGFMLDEGAKKIYGIAARAGVTNFVVPGTKPEIVKEIREKLEAHNISPVFYLPGFGAQGSDVGKVELALDGASWHPIVGRQIINTKDGDYRKAAEQAIGQLLR